jgi:hypothetical protein
MEDLSMTSEAPLAREHSTSEDELSADEGRFNTNEIIEPSPHPGEVIGQILDLEFVVLDEEIFGRGDVVDL